MVERGEVKCSENGTIVTRAAVARSNPTEDALKTSAQGHTEETDEQILSLHKHEDYPRVNV